MEDVAYQIMLLSRKFEALQNGLLADQMQQRGILYLKNYGVSLPDIDKIAFSIQKDNNFALYCFRQNLRELKLLALRIFNLRLIKATELDEILSGIDNIELAEQAAFQVFGKMPVKLAPLDVIFKSGNEFVLYSGLLSIHKILIKKTDFEEKEYLYCINLIQNVFWIDRPYIRRSLTAVLSKIAIINQDLQESVINCLFLIRWQNTELYESVKREILYFITTKN